MFEFESPEQIRAFVEQAQGAPAPPGSVQGPDLADTMPVQPWMQMDDSFVNTGRAVAVTEPVEEGEVAPEAAAPEPAVRAAGPLAGVFGGVFGQRGG